MGELWGDYAYLSGLSVEAMQDEVATLPHFIPMRNLDVKIGGNEIDRLRRWHRHDGRPLDAITREGGAALARCDQALSLLTDLRPTGRPSFTCTPRAR